LHRGSEIGHRGLYGKFTQEPTRPELERFFFLDDEDRKPIAKRRGDHNRLGFALQMCTVRYIGLFLEDPLAVPWPVVEHVYIENVGTGQAQDFDGRPAPGRPGALLRRGPGGGAGELMPVDELGRAELVFLTDAIRSGSVTRTWPGCPPLKHHNLNVLGRYSFTATQPAGGTLRPLRDPDRAGLDDEDGAEN
jgi:hypothetical protein